MEELLDTVEVGRPRREPEEPQFLDAEQAEALIEQAREQGVELLGEGGLLRQMTKAVLERALAEELTEHLGYEVGDPAGRACQDFCVRSRLFSLFCWGLEVGVDAVGVGDRELGEGLLPVRDDLSLDEAA